MKCCICKGKGIYYTENIKKSKRKNGKIQLTDLGWWSVCLKCNKQKYAKNNRPI